MTENESIRRRENRSLTDEELQKAVPRGKVHREFQVGLFVLVGVVSILAALFLLTDPSTFRGRYKVTTMVEDAGGIRRGDPVQMKGVNIGRVDGFSLTPGGVQIALELEGAWRIPANSRTRLVSSGILGGKTVEVIPGDSPEPLRSGENIPGEDVPGLMGMAPELGQNAEAVLKRIEELLDAPTVEAVQSSAVELRGLLARLSALAEEQGEEVARLTASLNRSARGLEEAAGSGDDLARAVARADSTLAVARATTETLQRASFSLEVILQRMESGEGTLGRLSTDSTLYDNLTAAAESIRALATDLREHPGRYVKIKIF
jgi:phospholipid/cholesterol/gamma-HCH transport system substrate-binding protein